MEAATIASASGYSAAICVSELGCGIAPTLNLLRDKLLVAIGLNSYRLIRTCLPYFHRQSTTSLAAVALRGSGRALAFGLKACARRALSTNRSLKHGWIRYPAALPQRL